MILNKMDKDPYKQKRSKFSNLNDRNFIIEPRKGGKENKEFVVLDGLKERRAYGDVDTIWSDPDPAKEAERSAIGVVKADEGGEIGNGSVLVVEEDSSSFPFLSPSSALRHC